MTRETAEVSIPTPHVRLRCMTLFVHRWQSDGADAVKFQIHDRYQPLTFPEGVLCVALFLGKVRQCACGVLALRDV
mgnify:FL=1